jgi:bifunctional DNase/RNase
MRAICRRGQLVVCLLFATASVAASACRNRPWALLSADEVKVEVAGVQTDSETGTPFVLLEDRIGGRRLPIWIGESEARSIVLGLHNIMPERPLTNDLMRNIIVQTGNHVDRVVISDLRDETYFALIYMNGGRQSIDSRPSDAIALALACNAPMFVVDRLFESTSARDLAAVGAGPDLARGFGLTVQDLSAPIAKFFGVAPGHGVLVADAKDPAARAGVRRGDVLVGIRGQLVKSLADFQRAMESASASPATVTILRDGERKSIGVPTASNPARQ